MLNGLQNSIVTMCTKERLLWAARLRISMLDRWVSVIFTHKVVSGREVVATSCTASSSSRLNSTVWTRSML